MDNEYLEDAVNCSSCGNQPRERIDREPFILSGIFCGNYYGTRLICFCGRKTGIHEQPYNAYREWNRMNGVKIDG